MIKKTEKVIDVRTSKKTISVLIDEEIKEQAEELFKKLGLTMTEAIHLFLEQAVEEQKLPFQLQDTDK